MAEKLLGVSLDTASRRRWVGICLAVAYSVLVWILLFLAARVIANVL